jgi:hypothetical protein
MRTLDDAIFASDDTPSFMCDNPTTFSSTKTPPEKPLLGSNAWLLPSLAIA